MAPVAICPDSRNMPKLTSRCQRKRSTDYAEESGFTRGRGSNFKKTVRLHVMLVIGGMAERSKAVVLKTTVPGTVPGVRIPLPPFSFVWAGYGPALPPFSLAASAQLGPRTTE